MQKAPAPRALFTGFGGSSLDFRLFAWVESLDVGLQAQNGLRMAVLRALDGAGIEIPYPQHDLRIRYAAADMLPVTKTPRRQAARRGRRPASGGGNSQCLAGIDLVRVLEHRAVGLEDLRVLIGVAVIPGDLRQRVSALDGIELRTTVLGSALIDAHPIIDMGDAGDVAAAEDDLFLCLWSGATPYTAAVCVAPS